MGVAIFPLLLLLTIGPNPKPSDKALADFSRFTRAIGAEVSLVEADGTVREGLVTAASTDQLTMTFAAGTRSFSRPVVASAERLRDSRKDGAIKGAIFGVVAGLVVAPFYDTSAQRMGAVVSQVALYSGIGWAVDAAQTHREPIYRSAPAPAAGVKVRARF